MGVVPGLLKQIHHYLTDTCLPYISNASPVETRPHFRAGSNCLTSLYSFVERRPGFGTDTAQTFTGTIARIFLWQRWNGDRYKMICTTSTTTGASDVWKLKIGTDVTYSQIYTCTTSTTAFDFAVANNTVYFGNGTDMRKWVTTSTTTNIWGIAKPAAAVTTSAVTSGSISAYNGGYRWVYAYGSSVTGHVGQRSDISAPTGNFTSKNYDITGSTTTDPQVNQVHVYRTPDGGGTFFELPNSPFSYTSSWKVTDSSIDTSLTTIPSALAGQNAPPTPSQGCVYFASRIWTFAGDTLYFSNFEEQVIGNGIPVGVEEESFSSINIFAFGRPITGLATCEKTLLVFTAATVFKISGDSLDTFRRDPFLGRRGATSIANIAQGGARTVAWLDTSGTVYVTDGITTTEIGQPIRSDLAAITQSNSSLAFHSDGVRSWLIVQDSAQDKMWVYDLDNGIWMVPWTIGGTAIHSGETAAGSYTLLLGRAFRPLKLTPSTYVDVTSTTYSATVTTNLMEMGEGKGPGEVANLQYVAIERNAPGAGTDPLADVSFLLDEDPATGTYQTIFANEVNPPNRTVGTNLVEKWYWATTTNTTARRCSIKLNWVAQETNFKWYAVDTVTNQIEGT